MRKARHILYVLAIGGLVVWSACDMFESSDSGGVLDERTTDQLDRSVANWNQAFAESGITLEGWTLGDRITPENRLEIVKKLTDPGSVWVPAGNIAEPAKMRAIRLADASEAGEAEARLVLNRIASEAVFGRHVATVRWTQDGESFTTTAILDEDDYVAGLDSIALAGRRDSREDDGLVYDPMLSNVFQMREETVVVDTTTEQEARQITFGWIWEEPEEFSLGQSITAVLPGCFLGNLLSCDMNCTLDLSRFDRRSVNASSLEGPGEGGCVMDYLQGFSTGTRRLRLNADSTGIVVEGQLGVYWSDVGSKAKGCSP